MSKLKSLVVGSRQAGKSHTLMQKMLASDAKLIFYLAPNHQMAKLMEARMRFAIMARDGVVETKDFKEKYHFLTPATLYKSTMTTKLFRVGKDANAKVEVFVDDSERILGHLLGFMQPNVGIHMSLTPPEDFKAVMRSMPEATGYSGYPI